MSPEPSRGERRVGAALTAAAILLYPFLLWRGWGAWHDVVVDFGRELYVPWRITEGDVLYRDLAWFNGPLSPYWNALVFLVGGVSLRTLTVANAVLTALFGWLLHRRVRGAAGPVAAGATLLFFEVVFACGHYPGTGNYNFLAPYSHELPHGLLLGLLAFSAALRARGSGRLGWSAATGLLLGLCFLTKAEVFVAAAGAVACVLSLSWRESSAGGSARRAGLVLGAALFPPFVAWGLFSFAMPAGDALDAVLGSWPGILGSGASELFFYQAYTGFDRWRENLQALAVNAAWLLAILGPAALLDLALRSAGLGLRLLVAGAYAALVAALVTRGEWTPLDWLLVARCLPLLALVAWLIACALAWRGAEEGRAAWGERAGFALFALLMTLKMILIAMLAHYGFALAVLAAALFAAVFLEWLPRVGRNPAGRGLVLRGATLALMGIVAVAFWRMSGEAFEQKSVVVGSGADAFRAEPPRAPLVVSLLEEIDARFGSQETLLVLPEGIMLNYLTRRRSPTRHVNFMPPEIELFGEEEILDELRASPPDALALVHKDTSEYGFPLFGTHYGTAIGHWVSRQYSPDWFLGDPPLQAGSFFGVSLLGRR